MKLIGQFKFLFRRLQEKISNLEGDVEALLLMKNNQREQIDNLVTRNNTLQNQIRQTNFYGTGTVP